MAMPTWVIMIGWFMMLTFVAAAIFAVVALVIILTMPLRRESQRSRESQESGDTDSGGKSERLAHVEEEHEPIAEEGSRVSVSESKTGPGWRYVASRAVGSSHVKGGVVCQDAYCCKIDDTGWLLIGVADGAGSAAFSDVGARLAVETAVRSVSECGVVGCEEIIPALRQACQRSRESIFREASNMDVRPRDLACTLLLCIAGPGGSGAAHIGDGVIASRHSGMAWDWMFWPQHGEYINMTKFLTDDDALEVLRVSSSSETPSEIAVMTDGLEYLALDFKSKSTHKPFFEGVVAPVKAANTSEECEQVAVDLGKWLGSERLSERSNDDLTLVLAIADESA